MPMFRVMMWGGFGGMVIPKAISASANTVKVANEASSCRYYVYDDSDGIGKFRPRSLMSRYPVFANTRFSCRARRHGTKQGKAAFRSTRIDKFDGNKLGFL